MEIKEAIDTLKNKICDYVIPNYCNDCENKSECLDDCNFILSIYTVLQEIEHLQKNNEELMNEYHKRVQERIDIEQELKDSISKDKIKCLILDKRKKIVENNIEIEECRKTIMEEQELKKLKLYTLHRKNDLLELEIADLFDLLKEE